MLKDFRPVLIILVRFIVIYLALLALYQWYLSVYADTGLDPFSSIVAAQAANIQDLFGYQSQLIPVPQYETTKFVVDGVYTSRMVEGCNAISVMILFAAFVFAFYKGSKTIVFVIIGVVLLHLMNILRIAGLNILILEHPSYSKIGHDYFFPAIIYGSVVILWLIWIKYFALKDETA